MADERIIDTEIHPLEPFLPEGAQMLMLGSFPPKRERWSMDFFYPNWINDMWRILGLVFFNNRDHFAKDGHDSRSFDKEKCISFGRSIGVAMYDTATEVRRLKDNASDKFLEVVRPTDISELLDRLPQCKAIVTTGQKATDTICSTFGCTPPATGSYTELTVNGRSLRFWRMPSSSRAYPMKLEKKAEFYRTMMMTERLIQE